MDRTPAMIQLIEIVRSIAANMTTGGEMRSEGTGPIEQIMAVLTPDSLGLVPYAHTHIHPVATWPGEVRYLHIAQESAFSIGVFVLPPGACIPLHDHPNMCVMSHVLYGSVKITCYDRIEGGAAAAGAGPSEGASLGSTLQSSQMAALRGCGWHSAPHTSRLTPSIANVHEIEAGMEGTAILDVLIPPYDEESGRHCTYYRPEGYPGAGGGIRLVPCASDGGFRVVRGEFIPPYPT